VHRGYLCVVAIINDPLAADTEGWLFAASAYDYLGAVHIQFYSASARDGNDAAAIGSGEHDVGAECSSNGSVLELLDLAIANADRFHIA
jgi:hypothetical protein